MEWDLSPIYSNFDDPQISKDMELLTADIEKVNEVYLGNLSNQTSSGLTDFISKMESIKSRIYDFTSYAELIVSVDQSNKNAVELDSKIRSRRNSWQKAFTPLELEFGNLLQKNPNLISEIGSNEYYLNRIKTQFQHKLTESEEILQLDKDRVGIEEWYKLQSELVSLQKYIINVDGEEKLLSWSEGNSLKSHKSHETRKSAINGLFGGLENISKSVAFALRNICTNHVSDTTRRKYRSYKESSYHSSHLSETIVTAMFEVILKNTQVFQEFLLLKAKILGTSKLRGEDFNAPYPFSDDRKIPWDQAKEIVNTGFHSFDPEFSQIAAEMFDKNRIDAKTRDAKVPGAFCAPILNKKISYILMSYNGNMGSVSTLAHEMGHAVHAEYIYRNQTPMNSEIGMPIAETASEFGSLLFNLKFLNEADTENQKKAIMFNMVERFMILIFEVGSRTLFEQALYEAIENEEYLSRDRINELFWETRKQIFGDAVEWLPEQVYEWVWKPHYYLPDIRFYNYPYVFGEFSVLGMYAEYRNDRESFVKNFKRFLSIGASQHPQDFMHDLFGFDLSATEFWENGMIELKNFLEECKKLID